MNLKTLEFENELIRIKVVPELGAKITEILDKEHNHQWLWRDDSRPLRVAKIGDIYEDYDITGMDECFPNIGVSADPNSPSDMLNDHGDIWSRAWDVEISDDILVGRIRDHKGRYEFNRHISLIGNMIRFSYSVANTSSLSYQFVWSAHPLFALTSKMEILLSGNPKMVKEFGVGNRLGPDGANGYQGHGDSYRWPYGVSASGERVDISQLRLSPSIMDKVIIETTNFSEVELRDLEFDRSCTLNFNPLEIPFLGICANLGAWPFTGRKQAWIALEPMFGISDSLLESSNSGRAELLHPGQIKRWSFTFKVD